MGNGLAALMGILKGTEGLPEGMVAGDQQRLAESKLAEQKRQFDETKTTDFDTLPQPLRDSLGLSTVTGKVPTSILPSVLSLGEKRAEREQERRDREQAASYLETLGRPTPAQNARELQPGEDPEAAAYLPTIPGKPGNARAAAAAPLIRLGKAGADLAKALFPDHDKPMVVGQDASVYDPASGTFKAAPRPQTEPFTPPAGYVPKYTEDKHGNVSKTWAPDVERTLSERLAEAEARYKANPTDPKARADYFQKKAAYDNEIRLAGAKAEAAAGSRPLPEGVQQTIGGFQTIELLAQQLKQFTPQEINAYTGLVKNGARSVGLAAKGLLGMEPSQADQRYAEFRALMGRLEATAFDIGGKNLTGIEKQIVSQYTPHGRELGGATEMLAKAKFLERFARMSRDMRLKLAQAGRGDIDLDALQAELQKQMGGGPSGQPASAGGWKIERVQ